MKASIKISLAATLAGTVAWSAFAGPGPDDDQLVIDGTPIVTELKAPEGHPLDIIYSGWRFRSDETQALETDDFENPAMVAVEYARELWDTPAGLLRQVLQ